MYSESNRGAQAVKLLQDAQAKFPGETSVTFELAAVLEKQKRYGEAEVVFRQLLRCDPEHAPTLNIFLHAGRAASASTSRSS